MNGNGLSAVPSLDALAADLLKVQELPPEVAKALWLNLCTLEKAVALRVMAASNGHGAPAPTQWLTPQEVAKRLGVKPSLVYELARAGKLKSCKLGKYRRFNEAAVQAYIESQEVDSARIRGG